MMYAELLRRERALAALARIHRGEKPKRHRWLWWRA